MTRQVFKNAIRRSFVAALWAALLATPLLAQVPAHNSSAGCYGPFYDGTYAIGAGPTRFDVWPAPTSNNVRMQLPNPVTGAAGSVVSVADGQWLFFRAVVGWWGADGRWYQRQGSLLASYNGFYQKVYRSQDDGRTWQELQPGGFDVTGHIIASQVALPGRGVYWYGAMYGWGAVAGSGFPGYTTNTEWITQVRC